MVLVNANSRNYSPATRTYGPAALDAAWTRAQISLSRESWPDTGGNVVDATLEISFNGGQTWELLTSFSAAGGDALDRFGNVIPTSYVRVTLPNTGTGRSVRGTVTNTATIRTAILIEAE